MPWCPVCHAEYRAGVKVCRECQVELVRTPPRPGEHYRPPLESAAEVAAVRVIRAATASAWGAQFVQGVKLFGESFRRVLRMRNLWWPMAVLAVLNTTGTLHLFPPHGNLAEVLEMFHYSPMGAVRETLQSWWGGALPVVRHLYEGIQEAPPAVMVPLGSMYGLALNAVSSASSEGLAWYDPRGFGLSVAYSLGYALITVALLRRVLASVREEEQTSSGARQTAWAVFAWKALSVWLLWWPLGILVGLLGPEGLRQAASAALGLLALPLTYTATVIVALRPPLRRAPLISIRVFTARSFTFLGLLLAYRACSDALGLVASPLRPLFWATWDPQFAARYAMPPLALLLNIAVIAVQLTLATAFVLIVLRTAERPQASPAPPEAAPA